MTFPFILFGVALWTTIGPKLRAVTVHGLLPRGVLLLALIIAAFTWFYPMRLPGSRCCPCATASSSRPPA